MTRLHLTNGDSAASSLCETSLGGDVLAWRYVLDSGPSLEQRDPRLVEALTDAAEVVLWFEHDLYDQLQLVDILWLARVPNPAHVAMLSSARILRLVASQARDGDHVCAGGRVP